MPITALPTPPSRSDPTNFAVRADAFLLQLNQFGTEANTLQTDVNAKQTAAAASQLAAANSETAAAASQLAAANSETAAAASQLAAASSETAAAASFVSFDKVFLGSKTSNPTLDNQGAALTTGAFYWNSAATEVRFYNGSSWSTQNVVTANFVDLSGPQTISGAKTFSTSPILPAGGAGSAAVRASEIPNLVFDSGTSMLFIQTSAPTGWTKSTAHNNKALRVVSGSAGSGGTVAFTTAFTSRSISGTVNNTILTEAQMPSHTHVLATRFADGGTNADGNAYSSVGVTGNQYITKSTSSTGGSTSHNHSLTMSNLDMAVQYVDTIIAIKD